MKKTRIVINVVIIITMVFLINSFLHPQKISGIDNFPALEDVTKISTWSFTNESCILKDEIKEKQSLEQFYSSIVAQDIRLSLESYSDFLNLGECYRIEFHTVDGNNFWLLLRDDKIMTKYNGKLTVFKFKGNCDLLNTD